jgi:hypothetical protein
MCRSNEDHKSAFLRGIQDDDERSKSQKGSQNPLVSVPFEVFLLIVEFLSIATVVKLWSAAPYLHERICQIPAVQTIWPRREFKKALRDCWMLAAPDSSPFRNSRQPSNPPHVCFAKYLTAKRLYYHFSTTTNSVNLTWIIIKISSL